MDDLSATPPAYRDRVAALGPSTIDDHLELRVTGQPGNGERPYDFTFRSDHEHWQHAAVIASRAVTQWADGAIELRRVRVERRVSEWVPIDFADLLSDYG